jgi:hypothetical protein
MRLKSLLHAPASLRHGKNPPVPSGKEAEQAPTAGVCNVQEKLSRNCCQFSRVAAGWPVQTKKLPVHGLSADRKNSCIVLLILNESSRHERSNYTLGALPNGRNHGNHHIRDWMSPRAGF